ncbi:MFS transporter [Amycolatopsis saalfeldensis]|uniref:Predicted arabinose efflux permease, MFS family n=1 Tax=Amycolatopsis saalfeldensis TaxID=394193 RepID=A0A1H8Y8B2_9PSEU|nr:MFS transporter [Amycolatopsis saalfeldensis]SEP48342.1 Predicted arabinose efflux permease, MFS family [Amycolatopsis saalfeldensis]
MVTADPLPASGSAGPGNLFWLGRLMSVAGTSFTHVALPLYAVVAFGASSLQVAGIAVAGLIPSLLAPLYVGMIASRMNARTAMVAADWLRVSVLVMVALLAASGIGTIQMLVLLAAVLGFGDAVFGAVLYASIEVMVGRDKLASANGRIQLCTTLGETAGTAAGGIVLQLFGAAVVFISDALSYVVSALTISKVSSLRENIRRDAPRTWKANVRAGAQLVRSSRPLQVLTITSSVFNFFAAGSLSVMVILLTQVTGFTSAEYGIVMACGAAGGVAGSLLVGSLDRRVRRSTLMATALILYGVAQCCYTVLRGNSIATVLIACLFDFAIGFGLTVYVVGSITVQQIVVPRAMLAQASAFIRATGQAAGPLGIAVAGFAAADVGVRPVVAAIGVGELLVAVSVLLGRRLLDAAHH